MPDSQTTPSTPAGATRPRIRFACYKFSPATISGLISWWTHSLYSHVAIVVDAVVYEAVDAGFVKAKTLGENHAKGTLVDIFEYAVPPEDWQAKRGIAVLEGLVGQKYDFAGIASFVTGGRIPESPCRVFCSEAAALCANAMNKPMQYLPPSSMMPSHVAMSLALQFVETETL